MAKLTISSVDVYKVRGETVEIAFNNLKQEHTLDNCNLEIHPSLSEDDISNGKIYKEAQRLYREYLNNRLSEFKVFGALYNNKPIIADPSRVITHNIITKGTKQWETVNSYRTDSGAILDEDTGTKAEALVRAKEIAIENNKTVNIVVSKRLIDMDGILGIAEFLPLDCIDDSNIYVFWKFTTKVEEKEEEEIIDENQEIDEETKQYSIKEDLFSYVGRAVYNKDVKEVAKQEL